jgi:diguanylate cyclase (GGDEF)-like protein
MSAGAAAPLFILSFRQRDELARLAESAGWQPIAARRARNAELRFIGSGAAVAVVDARGAVDQGHEAARALGDPVEANNAALLVLLSRKDAPALERFYAEGTTHFLVSPFSDQQFVQALQFAQRYSDRVGDSHRRNPGAEAKGASWHPSPVELSPAVARKAGRSRSDGGRIPLIEQFRRLNSHDCQVPREAIDGANGEPHDEVHEAANGREALVGHRGDSGDGSGPLVRNESNGSRDALTGLRNGRAARGWIDRQLGTADPDDSALVVLLLAVSRFDAINAAFGRATGDAVLKAAGRRIERLINPDAKRRMVARLAGAEFAVLLAAPADLAEGRFLAGQLVEAIGRPFLSGDHVITLGCRVGVVASRPEDDAANLLRRASAALAEAKAAESDRIRVLDAGAQAATMVGDRLEVDLRRALDQDEIEILFQPLVSVTTGRIEAAEALARWRHPRYGELGAVTLFSVAERSDYLVQLSDHVQRKAIAAAADSWPEALAGARLSINITAADIVRPGFAEQLVATIEASGFDPHRVTVEVTEGGLIEDLNAAACLLARLREAGLRVAIDDFGTGYSSLAYLKALPLDYLKIDKRLCEDIAGSHRDRIVVRGVIDMARSLGLGVIAEGVETQEQLDLLAREGCNLYQGYLCAPPLDVAALARLATSPLAEVE